MHVIGRNLRLDAFGQVVEVGVGQASSASRIQNLGAVERARVEARAGVPGGEKDGLGPRSAQRRLRFSRPGFFKVATCLVLGHVEGDGLFRYVYPPGFGRREWMTWRCYTLGWVGFVCGRCGVEVLG